MKRNKSISEWASTALVSEGKGALSKPPTSKRKPVVKRTRRTSSRSKHETTSSGKRAAAATPLVAGTLLGKESIPWAVRNQPKTASDLAVHKKKVGEVQQWLQLAFLKTTQHPVLLLTGPAGCGKTATIQALSQDMGFSVVEWANATDLPQAGLMEDAAGTCSHDWDMYESQSRQFQHFLIRANKYPALQLSLGRGAAAHGSGCGSQKKVVLVEDLPNAFIRDPPKLHSILRSVLPALRFPLVFIVSESQHSSASPSRLFPPSLTSMLDIFTISFNPVALTHLTKMLHRIAFVECQGSRIGRSKPGYQLPSKETIDTVAMSSAGDIRSAINTLQFACLGDPGDVAHQSARQAMPTGDSKSIVLSGVGGRDGSLYLFRALGKILYCKRSSGSDPYNSSSLPPHLSHHDRLLLQVDPENVAEASHLSADLLIMYLQQNYLDFYENMDDVTLASSYLSTADTIASTWTDSKSAQLVSEQCSCSLACRGIMFSNTQLSRGKWRPLHKPQWTTVNIQYKENSESARSLFLHLGSSVHSHLWTPVELQTEILPFTAIINNPLRNVGQASLLHTITHFRRWYNSGRVELLGETDVDQALDSSPPDSQSVGGQDIPGTKSGTHSHLASVTGEDDLVSSQRSGMTGCEEKADDEIEEFEEEW